MSEDQANRIAELERLLHLSNARSMTLIKFINRIGIAHHAADDREIVNLVKMAKHYIGGQSRDPNV